MVMVRSCSALLAFVLLPGCVALPSRAEVQRPAEVAGNACGVVFCADGSGGFGGTTRTLRQVAAEAGVRLAVCEVDWSHGEGRVLADQMDACNVQEQGQRLAGA